MIEAMLSQRRQHNRILLTVLTVLLYPALLLAEDIPLIKKGGVYEVPVEVNGAITLNFILDTGASEVNIPADVALTLYRAGTIRESDFLPGQTYRLADGSLLKSSRFLLQSLKIGKNRIANVPASIGNTASPLLLGQSFLERLGAWGIDSQKQVLTIGTKGNGELSITEQPSVPEIDKEEQEEIKFRDKAQEKIFIEGSRLSYEGYEVEISSKDNISFVSIKMNGKTIVYLDGGKEGWEHSSIGLFNLFGDKNKQLIIRRTAGNCCLTYKIYKLIPNTHLIFDDEEYGNSTGTLMKFVDLDGDGKYELVQFINTFNSFHGLDFRFSPFLEAVFSYENDKDRYVVANIRFSKYLLKNIEKYKKNVDSIYMLNNIEYDKYLSSILKVILLYIYNGKEEEGWKFFNTKYKLKNKEGIRSDILKTLASDPIYKAIYGR
jgi:clan AA aspartic protease (TIGR02281 family)